MLTVGDTADFPADATTVNIAVDGAPELKAGDTIKLISAGSALRITPTPTTISAGDYEFEVKKEGNDLIARVTKAATAPAASHAIKGSTAEGGEVKCAAATVQDTTGATTCTATASDGYIFDAGSMKVESGAGTLKDCSGATCTLTGVRSEVTISATFTKKKYAVTVTATGGTANCTPAEVEHGENVTVTCDVTPNDGYEFGSLSLAGGTCRGTSCTLTNVTGALTVNAAFTEVILPAPTDTGTTDTGTTDTGTTDTGTTDTGTTDTGTTDTGTTDTGTTDTGTTDTGTTDTGTTDTGTTDTGTTDTGTTDTGTTDTGTTDTGTTDTGSAVTTDTGKPNLRIELDTNRAGKFLLFKALVRGHGTIFNDGDADATNVPWQVKKADGSVLASGTVARVAAGGSQRFTFKLDEADAGTLCADVDPEGTIDESDEGDNSTGCKQAAVQAAASQSTSAAQPVPTLGEVGLLLSGLALAGAAAPALRRRREQEERKQRQG